MPNYMQAISRVLIASVFIVFGYIQATQIGNYIAHPAVIKVAGLTGILTPTIIAYMVMLINLVGGILIFAGYQTRWTSIVLIAFVILTLIFVHNFWTMEGPARTANQVQFYKNHVIIGALMLLICHGPGSCSLDHRFAKK